MELNGYARDMFKEEGLGSKIALLVHFFVTLTISWICDIIWFSLKLKICLLFS